MSLREAFNAQARACAELGSPFMARLLDLLAQDWPEDTALATKVAGFSGDLGPSGHSLPLRIAAGLHALVLSREAPALARHYPPHDPDPAELRPVLLETLRRHDGFLTAWIDTPPQTNEVRRSAALMAGARVAVAHFDLPVILSELGASGGLNLMWDHYALELDGHRYGRSLPAVTLMPDWRGPRPPEVTPRIVDRAGVDLHPLDLRRADHLLRLTAYLWPDQPDRLRLTRAAASIVEGPVTQGDAIDWLARRLPRTPPGHLHLIQHSVAWQYFPPATQARGRSLIEAAGARATKHRPLAWLAMEADRSGQPGAALTLRLWPGDVTLPLGRADFHGRWVDWQHPEAARI